MINKNGKNIKVAGIIVECNPFHKGHLRLIKECKKTSEVVVAVMSGNFVQRGEPAVYDKYRRTKDLLKSGVDLVIEIPIQYVLSSAKYFAAAGVEILDRLGFIDYIYFGSQIGNIEKLKSIASIYSKNSDADFDIDLRIRKSLKEGRSYASTLYDILNEKLSANDMLAIQYINALREIGSKIEPIAIKRKNDLPTASELRKNIKKKVVCDDFSDIINYKLLLAKNSIDIGGDYNIDDIYLMTDDMKNALIKSISSKELVKNLSFIERAEKLRTKNRTLAYIKRLFLNIIFDIKKEDVRALLEEHGGRKNRKETCDYIRILGVKKNSEWLLKKIEIAYLMSYAPLSYRSFIKKFKSEKDLFTPAFQKNVFANHLYYLFAGDKLNESEKPVVIL